jgi:hypothetical protein
VSRFRELGQACDVEMPLTLGVKTLQDCRRVQHRIHAIRMGGSICHPDAIRTTLDIDDELMRTLLDRLPGRSKTDAIEHAIEAFLADDAVGRLRGMAGTMEIADLSHELRTLDRTT